MGWQSLNADSPILSAPHPIGENMACKKKSKTNGGKRSK